MLLKKKQCEVCGQSRKNANYNNKKKLEIKFNVGTQLFSSSCHLSHADSNYTSRPLCKLENVVQFSLKHVST